MQASIILSDFIILSIVTYITYNSKKLRSHKNYRNISLFLVSFIIMVCSNYNGPSHLTPVLTLVSFVLLHYGLFKFTIIESIFTSVLEILFVVTTEFASMLIMNIVFGLNTNTASSSYIYILSLVLSNSLFYLLCHGFVSYKKMIMMIEKKRKFVYMLSIIPLCTILIFLSIPDYFKFVEDNKVISLVFISISVLTLLSIYVCIRLIYTMESQDKIKSEKDHIELEFEMYSKYYYSNFNLLHDLLHSYTEMKQLLDHKEYTELEQKLEDLSYQTLNEYNSTYSESLLLNTLISNRIEILKRNKILIKTKLLYSDFSDMNMIDGTKFLNQLLDTAISSCKEFETSIIYINLKAINEQLFFQVYFPCKRDITEEIEGNDVLNEIIEKYDITATYMFKREEHMLFLTFLMNKN